MHESPQAARWTRHFFYRTEHVRTTWKFRLGLVALVVIVAWLIDWTKDPMVPAWYQIVANVASIVGVMLLMPHAEVVRERGTHVAARA